MNYFNPMGKKIHSLEKAILKYRAFEMMIIIFHVEQLKTLVRSSIESGNNSSSNAFPDMPRMLPKGTKNLFRKIWTILVLEDILTQEESEEIQNLIQYRNKIAHSIQDLTFDASTQSINKQHQDYRGVIYKSGLLERIKYFNEKVYKGLSDKYIITIGFDELLFETAQTVYEEELERLDTKISKLKEIRKKDIQKLDLEFENIDKIKVTKLQPNHPENFLNHRKLSEKGVKCCYCLFDLKISDIMVSYLMKVPFSSIQWRRKKYNLINRLT